jgi:hypothetical protein
MKILFLCSCLAERHDGVGDYTRRLGSELIKEGHQVIMVSLNDSFVCGEAKLGYQHDQGEAIYSMRFGEKISWKQKITEVSSIVEDFNPDWISLQYVPYGFDKKGLPHGLAPALQKIVNNRRCHIMFHEIWVGITRLSSLKHKVYGFFQARIARDLVARLQPAAVTTSNELYKLLLGTNEIDAKVLPLFSNIRYVPRDEDFVDAVYGELGIPGHERGCYKMIGIFGSIYPGGDLESIIRRQHFRAKWVGGKLAFIAFGRSGSLAEYERLKAKFGTDVKFLHLGELPEERVSTVMQMLDAAISCTPPEHYGKSGVFAALKLHGLPVIASGQAPIPEFDRQIKNYNRMLAHRPKADWGADFVAKKFSRLLTISYYDRHLENLRPAEA